jgi:plastocyanin
MGHTVGVRTQHDRSEDTVTYIRILSSGLALLSAVALTACGGGGSTATAGAKPSGASHAITISNFAFQPPAVTVKRGTRVTVTNRDSAAHTATADDGHSFDTGNLDTGASKTITVSRPGTYAYRCTIHPFMHGTLIVK